tara:strand:- start:892 stop:2058 length:1167 start_codon:yes stop_codon:yes gene_type:complete
MAGGASGGADIEGRAFDAGPVGVGLADPQGTAAGLAQAQEAQNAFNAAMEQEMATEFDNWGSQIAVDEMGRPALNALTGKPMTNLDVATEEALTQHNFNNRTLDPDWAAPSIPNPMQNNPGWNYQDPTFNENLSGWPHTGSGLNIGGFTVDPNYNPGVSLIDPVDVTPSTNPGAKAILDAFGIENQSPTNQEEVDALMDDVLGQQSIFEGINVDPLDMSRAMASVENNPWGYNQSVIDALNASFDTGAVSGAGGEALQEALAQRAAETIIAQQAAKQVTPKSNKVTIPTSSGPDIVIDVTPPEPRNPVRSRPVRPENVEQRNPSDSPVRIAAKTISKQKAFKKLPKFAQKELRQGKVPTTGSDYVQQMVSDFLGPARISSAYTDMTSR